MARGRKPNEAPVHLIRAAYEAGTPVRDIAAQFGVKPSYISMLRTRNQWVRIIGGNRNITKKGKGSKGGPTDKAPEVVDDKWAQECEEHKKLIGKALAELDAMIVLLAKYRVEDKDQRQDLEAIAKVLNNYANAHAKIIGASKLLHQAARLESESMTTQEQKEADSGISERIRKHAKPRLVV